MYSKLLIISVFIFGSSYSIGQTTAMNFQQNDCNGNPQDLFADLDAGKAVVLFYYMPNCGSCPPPAQKIQTMANNINAICPGLVKGYANSYLNSTTCAYTAGWVTSNNLPLYTPMGGTGADEVAYYGGFGMPTVVLVGGPNHDVLFVTQNFVTSDTTVMRDLILEMSCVAGESELEKSITSLEVYPNPVNNELTFSLDGLSDETINVQLHDLSGRVVFERNEMTVLNGSLNESFDVTAFPSGNYFLKLDIDGEKLIEKVIIQH